MPSDIENTAVRAVLAGGRILRERFAQEPDADFSPHDVKAAADRASEERMLDVIRDSHPGHAVYAEESGDVATGGDRRWIVDPLDGTNNFVAGLPSFASAAVVLDDDGPLAGAVYVPTSDDLYAARRGEGVTHDGAPVDAASDVPVAAATVGFVIGHDVKLDGRLDEAAAMQDSLAAATKRVIESWSPCVHWGALARGRLDGMVCFHPDDEEQQVGELLASEAGASVARPEDGLYVAATRDAVCEALVAAVA
jgi:myo-inositol-1(or 4)-monophosphatase